MSMPPQVNRYPSPGPADSLASATLKATMVTIAVKVMVMVGEKEEHDAFPLGCNPCRFELSGALLQTVCQGGRSRATCSYVFRWMSQAFKTDFRMCGTRTLK